MHINTKSVFEWDKKLKKYVEIHNEGYEYNGEIAEARRMGWWDEDPGGGGGGYTDPGGGGGGDEDFYPDPQSCISAGGMWENEGCIFPQIGDGDGYGGGYTEESGASCTPGTMYYDWEGNLKYCQGGSGLYGSPLEEWQGGGGWETEANLPSGFDLSGQRNIFDVLPPEVLQHIPPELWGTIGGSYADIEERPEWESYLGDIKGLQAGTGAERRKMQESLRAENLYGGVSSSFAGGGGGVMPERGRTGAMRTFRDFLGEQETERAGYELGFEETAEGLRSQWEEDIQTGYANLLAGDPTGYCTTCEPNQLCMGKDENGADICEDYANVDWSNIQETWLG